MSSILRIGSISDISSSSVNTLSSTCGCSGLFCFSLLPCSIRIFRVSKRVMMIGFPAACNAQSTDEITNVLWRM